MRAFAFTSHPANWPLKSIGEVKRRPGRNEDSTNPLSRSTMPLYSASRGGASRILAARVPANAAAGAVTLPPPPIADCRSRTSVFVTRPRELISCHIPARISPP